MSARGRLALTALAGLIGIGVLGEYLGRIYDEAKQRPLYVLKPTRTNVARP